MKRSSRWHRWSNPSRLLPLLTIIGAGVFLMISTIGVVNLSISESVIIALLALTAIDSLSERLGILEKIEIRLDQITPQNPLRKRDMVTTPDKFAADATSIHIMALSAISITAQYLNFYERKIDEGCNLQIILLEPNDEVLQVLELQVLSTYNTKQHIESNIQALRGLTESKSAKGGCEVRLSKTFFPYSMVGINFGKSSGKMIVEFHGYKIAVDERPHVLLAQDTDYYWFDFYHSQFVRAWADARKLA